MGHKHKTRRVGSAKRTVPARPWTNEEIDMVLDEMLPLDNKYQLHLWQCRLSEKFNRGMILHRTHKHYGVKRSRKSIELLVYKLGAGYKNLRRYLPQCRTSREGKPLTWMEYEILRWGFDPKLDAAKAAKCPDENHWLPMTVEHMALILQRPVAQIQHEVNRILGKDKPTLGVFR